MLGGAHGHEHGHAHGDPHGAGGERPRNRRRLALTLVLVVLYMAAEVVGGVLSGSLALLADAGHMFSDAAALGLSLFAVVIAQRPPTPQRTYGYYRVEILAALANGALLGGISLFILYEAIERLGRPVVVDGPLLLAVASGGLVVNVLGLVILSGGRQSNLNVRGAFLHVLSDALGSVGAIASGLLVWLYGWHWADPAASLLIALLVVVSAYRLLRETVSVLMESAPRHLDVEAIREAMQDLEGVVEVHDLHVWTITSGMEALSGHVVVREGAEPMVLLRALRDDLHERFGIGHVTLQMEPEGFEEPVSHIC